MKAVRWLMKGLLLLRLLEIGLLLRGLVRSEWIVGRSPRLSGSGAGAKSRVRHGINACERIVTTSGSIWCRLLLLDFLFHALTERALGREEHLLFSASLISEGLSAQSL